MMDGINKMVGWRKASADHGHPTQVAIDFDNENNFGCRNGPSGPPKIESDFTDAPVIPQSPEPRPGELIEVFSQDVRACSPSGTPCCVVIENVYSPISN